MEYYRSFPQVVSRQAWVDEVSAWLEASCPSPMAIRRFAQTENHRPQRWWQEVLNRLLRDRKIVAKAQLRLQNRLWAGLSDQEAEELEHLQMWGWALDAALQELDHA